MSNKTHQLNLRGVMWVGGDKDSVTCDVDVSCPQVGVGNYFTGGTLQSVRTRFLKLARHHLISLNFDSDSTSLLHVHIPPKYNYESFVSSNGRIDQGSTPWLDVPSGPLIDAAEMYYTSGTSGIYSHSLPLHRYY